MYSGSVGVLANMGGKQLYFSFVPKNGLRRLINLKLRGDDVQKR